MVPFLCAIGIFCGVAFLSALFVWALFHGGKERDDEPGSGWSTKGDTDDDYFHGDFQ